MCSFVTESCPKAQRYILYLKTVNIQNEMDRGEAVNKAKNYISLLVKATFWWYTFKKISQYPASLLPCDNRGYFQSMYNEKLKLFSPIPSLYKKINIDGLSSQFNSLSNSNIETVILS